MPLETALTERLTTADTEGDLRVSSAIPRSPPITAVSSRVKPLMAGLFVTLAQIVVAVCLLAPEGTLSYRYSTLIQHDSYWFMNIVDHGYHTTVPPVNHKVLEVSNVAFFPAYPALASLLRYLLHVESDKALLITAQLAAWGFWTYFFLFCERWNLSPKLRWFGALSIVAHPTAFFLIAGYSESLFLMSLLGFIYWSSEEGGRAKVWAALHGVIMSATRIVGIPCAAFPVVRSLFAKRINRTREPRAWFREHLPAIGLMVAATSGAVLFFIYCQLRWGRWDMYMLTQSAGWGITSDYLAVFKPSSYHWLLPALNNPTQASQMAVTLALLMFVVIAICELIPDVRRRTNWPVRVGFYFCAAIIYYISVSAVASVEMESMLRYEFCVHALIVLAFLHLLRQYRVPPVLVRAFGMAVVALGGAAGLSVQAWYIWNFTRGNWVA
jgi:hypothetical protein